MEHEELLRRLQDLSRRCDRAGIVTHSAFLTPTEQAAALAWAARSRGPVLRLFGGGTDCERKIALFLPEELSPEQASAQAPLSAVKLEAAFGTPGHRDYLGALLALGVRREWIGDIRVLGQTAWVFCLPTVAVQLAELRQAGRVSVKGTVVPLSAVPEPEYRTRELRFTVQSLRFDAVVGEMFRISRSQAVKLIAAGAAKLNDLPCLKNDAPVGEGDVISLRGHGKGSILSVGGRSKKDRLFLTAELRL